MTTYYTFTTGGSHIKLVKIDNFYSVTINRKRLGSTDNLEEAKKLFVFICQKLVFNTWTFNLNETMKIFSECVIFTPHRNKLNISPA